jgi:hypothetical protein
MPTITQPESEYWHWSRTTLDAARPMRIGPLLYVGTTRGGAAHLPMSPETYATSVAAFDEKDAVTKYVRACDVVLVEQREPGAVRVDYLTHARVGSHCTSPTDVAYIEGDNAFARLLAAMEQ